MTSILEHVTSDEIPELLESDLDTYIEQSKSVQEKLNPTLCCLEVENITVDISKSCNKCQQTVVVLPNKKIVTCQSCSTTMKAEKCFRKFNCELTIADKVLTLPREVIELFSGKNVIEWCDENLDGFKEYMLFLQNIDFTASSKSVITKMHVHE